MYVLETASDAECLEIEMKFEGVLGGLWDETDQINGRIRYRHHCDSHAESLALATQLMELDLKAEIRLKG